MNVAQAAFDILALISLADETNQEEIRVIEAFLEEYIDDEELDAQAETNALVAMTEDQGLARFKEAVAFFKNNAPQKYYQPLVELAVKVAKADAQISEIEGRGVNYLADQLGIDV